MAREAPDRPTTNHSFDRPINIRSRIEELIPNEVRGWRTGAVAGAAAARGGGSSSGSSGSFDDSGYDDDGLVDGGWPCWCE